MLKTLIRQFVMMFVLLLALTKASQAQEATPEAVTEARRLLFVSERDGNREIYVVNDDGTGLQNLTNNPADDAYPAWSADGEQIIFQSDRTGEWAFYQMDADGSNLVAADEGVTGVSPDQTMLINRVRSGTFWQLTAENVEYGTTQMLTVVGADDDTFSWSPDSLQIAFERSGEIYSVTVDENPLPINLTLSEAYDSSPAWSPAGNQIAYASNWDIYTMHATDGSEAYNLTQNPAYDISPAWSPDAQQIAFASFRDANWEIYAMNSDGCNVRRLTNDEGWDGLPQWQPQTDVAATIVERAPTAIVTTPNANLRDGAGENFAVIATAAQGECLSVIGRNIDGAWLQIQHQGTILWVSASIVKIVGNLEDVPTLER